MKSLSALLGMVTGAIVTTLGLGSAALAADFSFRGTFTRDNDMHSFDFSVGKLSPILFRTYSYAGGIQADGTKNAPGGFDPVLTLFDGEGNLIGENDDDMFGLAEEDPKTKRAFDSSMSVLLDAGNYTVYLTQYDNFAVGPNRSDGFVQAGNGHYTRNLKNCTTDALFCDFTGNVRTGKWAFDAIGVLPLLEADEIATPVIDPLIIDPLIVEPPVIDPPVIDPRHNPTHVPEPATTIPFALAGLGTLVQRRRTK